MNLAVSIADAAKTDPTGTGSVRANFQKEMRARFAWLKRMVVQAIVEMDVLGINMQQSAQASIAASQFVNAFSQNMMPKKMGDQVPGENAFAFTRSSDRVAAFMEWLKQEQQAGILNVTVGTPARNAAEASWMNVYIDTAYKKGLRDSAGKMRKAGAKVKESFISNAFNRPIHADRVGLIYTRTFQELEGITAAMDQKIARTLAQGVAEGLNPRQIATNISEDITAISRNRAEVLARTEVIGAHAEASLNAYQEAGIEGVEVEAEWATAGDDRVCDECEPMEGKVFSLDESRGMIPAHPNCRCAWLPVVVNGTGITLE